jgi:hypothetical protein
MIYKLITCCVVIAMIAWAYETYEQHRLREEFIEKIRQSMDRCVTAPLGEYIPYIPEHAPQPNR